MDDARFARHVRLRPNNFDLIRLAAALQVVLLHSVEGLGLSLPNWAEPIRWFPGVPIFFVLSGFLVSLSYERNPDIRSYAVSRLLRIFPALWVCFFLSLLSVAWIRPDRLTLASPADLVSWGAAQLSIGQVFNPSFLRDYGVGALNGSLWTIPVELQFYAVIPILYFALGLHRRRSAALVPLIIASLVLNRVFAGWKLSSDSLAMKLFGTTFVPHVWYFLVGIFVQRNFGRLRSLFAGKAMRWVTAHLAGCALLAPLGWHVSGNLIGPLPSLTLIGVTFSLAYTAPTLSERLLQRNDVSYGTYLYHMVIVNAVIEMQWARTTTTILAVFTLTLACATLSWKFVEQPALAWKHVFQRPAIPVFEMDVGRTPRQPAVAERDERPEATPSDASQQPAVA